MAFLRETLAATPPAYGMPGDVDADGRVAGGSPQARGLDDLNGRKSPWRSARPPTRRSSGRPPGRTGGARTGRPACLPRRARRKPSRSAAREHPAHHGGELTSRSGPARNQVAESGLYPDRLGAGPAFVAHPAVDHDARTPTHRPRLRDREGQCAIYAAGSRPSQNPPGQGNGHAEPHRCSSRCAIRPIRRRSGLVNLLRATKRPCPASRAGGPPRRQRARRGVCRRRAGRPAHDADVLNCASRTDRARARLISGAARPDRRRLHVLSAIAALDPKTLGLATPDYSPEVPTTRCATPGAGLSTRRKMTTTVICHR